MPTKYSLTIDIDERWVKTWGNSQMRICFGTPVNGPSIGVAAFTNHVLAHVDIEWESDWYIAATKTDDSPIVVVNTTTTTNFVPIAYGQKYVLDNGDPKPPSDSPDAPKNGFLFQNVTAPWSAVLAKKINGKIIPFYVSPTVLPPSGTTGGDRLIPSNKVAVWFEVDVETGGMSDHDQGEKFVVDMDQPDKKVKFDADGKWSIET